MNTKHLVALAVVAGLLNPIAAITNSAEHMSNSEPAMLAMFAIPWLVGAELVRRGKPLAGGIVISLLSILTIVSARGWHHHSIADWTEQSVSVVTAVACLTLAVTLNVRRHRAGSVAHAAS